MSEFERKWEIYVVPGSHFDLGWCAAPAECLAYADEIIREALDAMEEYPDYCFTVEYAMFLQHFLKNYPDYLPQVEKFFEAGRLEVCSVMAGGMEQILDGEVLIQEIVMAKRWAKESFGVELIACQHSDLPGHTIQIPQILAKAGIRYFTYSRLHPPKIVHWWKAPDGSRVLACHHYINYGWGFVLRKGYDNACAELPQQLKILAERWLPTKVYMCDEMDLIMPEPKICEVVERWNREKEEVKFKISTLTNFFEALSKDTEDLEKIPTYIGERPYGFYCIPAGEIKTYQEARKAENELLSAEKFSTWRHLLGWGIYPKELLDEGWASLFYCHDHNFGGRHGEINDEVRTHKATHSRIIAEELLQEFVIQITTHIDYQEGGIPLVIFNPLSWKRSDLVVTHVIANQSNLGGVVVKDANGKELPCQMLKKEEASEDDRIDAYREQTRFDILFVARDVPSMGYKVYYVYPYLQGEEVKYESDLEISENKLKNSEYEIELTDGFITSLKYQGMELLGEDEYKFNEIVILEDIRHDLEDDLDEEARQEGRDVDRTNFTGRQWRASDSPTQVEIVERGPVRATLRISGKILDIPIVQEITLYKGLPRIDLTVGIDWNGKKNTLVQLALPFAIPDSQATYETPFGHVVFGQDEMEGSYKGAGGRFVQKWGDVSNDDYGVTLATQNCTHFLKDNGIYPVLIRTAYSSGTPFLWYYQCGRHTFRHSLLPHRGDWKSAHSFRHGWEFNNPLMVGKMDSCHPISPIIKETFADNKTQGKKVSFKGKDYLAEEGSMGEVDKEHIVLTTIKQAMNKDGWIVRLFEVEGKEEEITLKFSFPIKRAWEVDLMENEIESLLFEDNEVKLQVDPYGIHTLKVWF